jgi:hypothetical protein
MTPKSQLHLATGGRVLDCVRDEIEEELPQARPVSHDYRIGRERKIHRHPLSFAEYQSRLVDLLAERRELPGLALEVLHQNGQE